MSLIVTFVSLLIFKLGSSTNSPCLPNTQFTLNGRSCICDNFGQWSYKECASAAYRFVCEPGHVIWQGCNQCICQENREYLCSSVECADEPKQDSVHFKGLDIIGPWCDPYRLYFVNCHICVCRASGKSTEAHCAVDSSCNLKKSLLLTDLLNKKHTCLPNVLYVFPCLHCLCTNSGYLDRNKCIETCEKSQIGLISVCTPNTFYKNKCNVCRCPENGIRDEQLCTRIFCDNEQKNQYNALRSQTNQCTPHTFSKPTCFYCDCDSQGAINKKACLELVCLDNDLGHDKFACIPGEMVQLCTQCFCPKSGTKIETYCTKTCSQAQKLAVLEKALKDGLADNNLFNLDIFEAPKAVDSCKPDTVYISNNKYCICSDSGKQTKDLCASVEVQKSVRNKTIENNIAIDFNAPCEPNTFIDFDCNTCYCSKRGKIDPNWCTHDDCDAKKDVIKFQMNAEHRSVPGIKGVCTPGTLYKDHCNYCICPPSGLMREKACTKNKCPDNSDKGSNNDKFVCEPISYYEVDCNVCFCPRDGLTNLAKCTKNVCESHFLRSSSCVPEELFSDECNICVCPANGIKADKVCTNYTCTENAGAWKNIFKFSHALLNDQTGEDNTRNLDFCFPGEEFIVDCQLCVCPELGLRKYASCTEQSCETSTNISKRNGDVDGFSETESLMESVAIGIVEDRREMRRYRHQKDPNDICITLHLNKSDIVVRKYCTPGSMYIIRCQECICPYAGKPSEFCRPLDPSIHCEQAWGNVDYVPADARRDVKKINNTEVIPKNITLKIMNTLPSNFTVRHRHTLYPCSSPGNVTDGCFACECENGYIIQEHCFKNTSSICKDQDVMSFLFEQNKFDD